MQRLLIFPLLLSLAGCNGGGDEPMTDDGPDNASQSPAATDNGSTGTDTGDSKNAGGADNENEQVTLTTGDGVKVFGTLRQAGDDGDRIALLFHQARSNRHEYDPIAPRLNELGFDTLAVDQRSGGTMWGHDNKTVEAAGEPSEYRDALPDLKAALDWAVKQDYQTIVTVGSSYSAALNFLLARENADKLTAIASFSPGEYLGQPDLVKNAAAELTLPIYVTAGVEEKEQSRVDEVLSKADSGKIVRHVPEHGIHGASTLRQDKNPEGATANFEDFREFLEEVE